MHHTTFTVDMQQVLIKYKRVEWKKAVFIMLVEIPRWNGSIGFLEEDWQSFVEMVSPSANGSSVTPFGKFWDSAMPSLVRKTVNFQD